MSGSLLYKNRKALFDHSIIEKYVAGIVLTGAEVKAVREGNISSEGSYIQINDGIPLVVNMYIGRYSKQGKGFSEENSRHSRKLLLTSKEIKDIDRAISEKGKTAIPLALVLENNLVKMELAVVKGLKEFEKKQVSKDKQVKKDLERESKEML